MTTRVRLLVFTLLAVISVPAGLVVILASARLAAGPSYGPLTDAARRGDLMVVRALLVQGVAPDSPDGPRGFRPLATAARASHLDVMNALLDAGAGIDLRDAGGNRWIPLMHAVHKHQTAAVRLLLERGARPDGPDGLRLTPLMMAAASGQTDVVRLLLDRGADPRRLAPDGATILALAATGGAFTDIDEPLLGRCHGATVRLIRERIPDLGLGSAWRARAAMLIAWWQGCDETLAAMKSSPRINQPPPGSVQ
jgi:hypothetical protein